VNERPLQWRLRALWRAWAWWIDGDAEGQRAFFAVSISVRGGPWLRWNYERYAAQHSLHEPRRGYRYSFPAAQVLIRQPESGSPRWARRIRRGQGLS